MPKTWITSDLHLGENRFDIIGRPFCSQLDMCSTLRYNYNSVVHENDWVLWVGDAVYQKTPEFLEYVKLFNGRKILYRGNHDRIFTDEQLQPYFEKIVPEGEGEVWKFGNLDCWVTHYPTRANKNFFNIVGHVHSAFKVQLNMFNCGVDVNHFFPVDSSKVEFYYNAICNFYDEDVWVAYDKSNLSYLNIRGKKGSYFE